jgi:hypothetical protein
MRNLSLTAAVVTMLAIAGSSAYFADGDDAFVPRAAAFAHPDYPDFNHYDPPADEHYVRHF